MANPKFNANEFNSRQNESCAPGAGCGSKHVISRPLAGPPQVGTLIPGEPGEPGQQGEPGPPGRTPKMYCGYLPGAGNGTESDAPGVVGFGCLLPTKGVVIALNNSTIDDTINDNFSVNPNNGIVNLSNGSLSGSLAGGTLGSGSLTLVYHGTTSNKSTQWTFSQFLALAPNDAAHYAANRSDASNFLDHGIPMGGKYLFFVATDPMLSDAGNKPYDYGSWSDIVKTGGTGTGSAIAGEIIAGNPACGGPGATGIPPVTDQGDLICAGGDISTPPEDACGTCPEGTTLSNCDNVQTGDMFIDGTNGVIYASTEDGGFATNGIPFGGEAACKPAGNLSLNGGSDCGEGLDNDCDCNCPDGSEPACPQPCPGGNGVYYANADAECGCADGETYVGCQSDCPSGQAPICADPDQVCEQGTCCTGYCIPEPCPECEDCGGGGTCDPNSQACQDARTEYNNCLTQCQNDKDSCDEGCWPRPGCGSLEVVPNGGTCNGPPECCISEAEHDEYLNVCLPACSDALTTCLGGCTLDSCCSGGNPSLLVASPGEITDTQNNIRLISQLLTAESIPHYFGGGVAVALHVQDVDSSMVRWTKDIDLVIDLADLAAVAAAVSAHFDYDLIRIKSNKSGETEMTTRALIPKVVNAPPYIPSYISILPANIKLQNQSAKGQDAVGFATGLATITNPRTASLVTKQINGTGQSIKIPDILTLVQMKLESGRLKDYIHLQDLLAANLIDENTAADLPLQNDFGIPIRNKYIAFLGLADIPVYERLNVPTPT